MIWVNREDVIRERDMLGQLQKDHKLATGVAATEWTTNWWLLLNGIQFAPDSIKKDNK